MTERQIQKQAVELLRKAGYYVCVTSDSRKNRTRGVPDLIIHIAAGFWIVADAKSPDGRLTPEQQVLVDAERLVIFRDPLALLERCKTMRKILIHNA